jgi:hypothetical protein
MGRISHSNRGLSARRSPESSSGFSRSRAVHVQRCTPTGTGTLYRYCCTRQAGRQAGRGRRLKINPVLGCLSIGLPAPLLACPSIISSYHHPLYCNRPPTSRTTPLSSYDQLTIHFDRQSFRYPLLYFENNTIMSAEEVAKAFVGHYYQSFASNPDSLAGLYVSTK